MCRGFADEWSSGGGVGCGTGGKAMSSAAASKQGLQYAVTTEAQLAAEHILREHKLYSPESRSKSEGSTSLGEALLKNDWAELIRQLYRHPSVLGGGPGDVNAAVEAIGKVVPDLNLQVVKYNLLDSWLRSGTGAGKSTLKTDFIFLHFTAKKIELPEL